MDYPLILFQEINRAFCLFILAKFLENLGILDDIFSVIIPIAKKIIIIIILLDIRICFHKCQGKNIRRGAPIQHIFLIINDNKDTKNKEN